MPTGAFNICCPRDCVSRHNGGTSGTPLKPRRVDSALRALSTLRGLRGAPEVPPLCRETQSLGQQMLNEPLGIDGKTGKNILRKTGTIPCLNIFAISIVPLYRLLIIFESLTQWKFLRSFLSLILRNIFGFILKFTNIFQNKHALFRVRDLEHFGY